MYDDIIGQVANAADRNDRLKPQPGDYIKDGLLHCGKCNTAKQVRFQLGDITYSPYCLCECAAAALLKEEEDRKKRERAERIERRRREAFPAVEMANYTLANNDGADERLTRIAEKYVEKFGDLISMQDNNGLLLCGTVGTGKTYIAAAIVNALISKGYRCRMTTMSRLVNELGSSFDGRQEYIDELCDQDLLVIDDLAAERDSDYMLEIILNVIDTRACTKKPLIITSNLTAEQIKNPENEKKRRIYSRIMERCYPVEVKGADRRKAKLKDNFKNISELLGE